MSFGGLAAGLGAGAIAEVARRGLGIGSKSGGRSYSFDMVFSPSVIFITFCLALISY